MVSRVSGSGSDKCPSAAAAESTLDDVSIPPLMGRSWKWEGRFKDNQRARRDHTSAWRVRVSRPLRRRKANRPATLSPVSRKWSDCVCKVSPSLYWEGTFEMKHTGKCNTKKGKADICSMILHFYDLPDRLWETEVNSDYYSQLIYEDLCITLPHILTGRSSDLVCKFPSPPYPFQKFSLHHPKSSLFSLQFL